MPPTDDAHGGHAPDHEQPLQGLRVLVCEDEGITQMQLSRIVSRAGMSVVGSAMNGQIAVELAASESPHIVLMDISMPVMDGLEAARRILSKQRCCIIMLTANNGEEYLREARSLGVSGYVDKPVSRDALLPRMEAAWRSFQEGAPPAF